MENNINKLAEDNLNLVFFVCQKLKVSGDIRESDEYQEGTIGLTLALLNYKNDKNINFSTFAVKCIINQILKYWKYISSIGRKSNVNVVYLNELVYKNNYSYNQVTLLNQLEDKKINIEDDVEQKLTIEEIFEYIKITEKNKNKIDMFYLYYIKDMSKIDIAIIKKCSVQNVQCLILELQRKLSSYFKSIE